MGAYAVRLAVFNSSNLKELADGYKLPWRSEQARSAGELSRELVGIRTQLDHAHVHVSHERLQPRGPGTARLRAHAPRRLSP